MSNFRVVDGFIIAGMLGALVLGGVLLSRENSIRVQVAEVPQKVAGEFRPVHPFGNGGTNSPLTVRGGSLNFFANNNSAAVKTAGWQCNVINFCSENLGVAPNILYLDGVAASGTIPGTPSPLKPTKNWILTLNLHKDDKNNPTLVNICTQPNAGLTGCDPNPTGNIVGTMIYVQEVQGGTLSDKEIDRTGQNARLHLAVTNCMLSNQKGDGTTNDLDTQCDKISGFAFQESGGTSQSFECIDGACYIAVGPPMS